MKYLSLLIFLIFTQNAHARLVLDAPRLMMDESQSAIVRSEKLASAGEIFLSRGQYGVASRIFEMSLAMDPKNPRANFHSRSINVFLTPLKGLLTKLLPLINNPDSPYIKDALKAFSDPALWDQKRILFDANERPFKSGEDLRLHLKKSISALDEFIEYTRKSENTQLTITHFGPGQTHTMGYQSNGNCRSYEPSPNIFFIEECATSPYQSDKKMKFNKYDWIGLRYSLIEIKWKALLLLSYSFEDLGNILSKISSMTEDQLTAETVVKLMRKSSSFGKLVDSEGLNELHSLGNEASFLIRNMKKYKNCAPTDQGAPREGHYIKDFLCFDVTWPFFNGRYEESEHKPIDAVIELIRTVVVNEKSGGSEYSYTIQKKIPHKITIDNRLLVEGRINSLLDFLPTRFDNCGRAIEVSDPSVRGLFPNKDYMTVLKNVGPFRGKSNCVSK